MIGLISYGGYIPRYRLNRESIFKAIGWLNAGMKIYARGEKAIANYDEDSITMATSACYDCLSGFNRAQIDGLYFASTTMPYKERLNAGIISTALNLPPSVRTADFCNGLKSGTTALISALESIEAKGSKKILVCAADTRLGRVGSVQEMIFGDGAAAFLVGDDDIVAEFKGSYSLTYDFVDHYRGDLAVYDRSWEERWIRDEGMEKIIPLAIQGFINKFHRNLFDFSKIIYPCPLVLQRKIAKKLGIKDSQLLSALIEEIGDTGTAHPLIMLAKALEEATPGEELLVVSFGNGCDVLLFKVTEKIKQFRKRRGIGGYMKRRVELNYEKYLVFKGLCQTDLGLRSEEDMWTRWSFIWRNRKSIFGLVGSRCMSCGTPQYPPQRVCINPDCGAIDQMEDYSFADKKGTIINYTGDMLAVSLNPPAIYGQIDFEGGGRYWFDLTDCSLEEIKVGLEVEMTFRRRYYDTKREIRGYFWKATPLHNY